MDPDPGVKIKSLKKYHWKYLFNVFSNLFNFFSYGKYIVKNYTNIKDAFKNIFGKMLYLEHQEQQPEPDPSPKPFRNRWDLSSIAVLRIGIVLMPIQIRVRIGIRTMPILMRIQPKFYWYTCWKIKINLLTMFYLTHYCQKCRNF